jgi:uncharacterized membrane protein YcaP (DUF421 family)
VETLHQLLGVGVEPKHLTFPEIALRGVIVFITALIIVRMADRRFLSRLTILDAILGFALASMFARAINGSAPLFPTLGGAIVLVLLHRLLAWLACRSAWVGKLVKGEPKLLVRDGQIQTQALRANSLTERDLDEEVRQEGKISSSKDVKEAYLERSGKISVVPKKSK